jgi:HlyD family secretion protein
MRSAGLAFICLLLICPAGCKRTAASEDADDDDSLPGKPVLVHVAKTTETTLRPTLELAGTLAAIPERTAIIGPQTSGRIDALLAAEGAAVHNGQPLVRLDSRAAQVDLARAEAALAEKQASLLRLQHQPLPQDVKVARSDRDKAALSLETQRAQLAALRPLRAKNEIPAIQLDAAEAALHSAEADLQAAEAKLQLVLAGPRPEEIAEAKARVAGAEADCRSARVALDFCTVATPIGGTVTQLSARLGMVVDRSTTLATVSDLSRIFAEIRVPGAFMTRVHAGAAVTLRVPSLGTAAYHGKLARTSGQADANTGDMTALAEFDNSAGVLRPALACRVEISLPEVPRALVIPRSAVADREGTSVVTVVRKEKAYETEVKLGIEVADQSQVLAGLAAGDTVVTEGGYGLPKGCPVEVAK